MANEETESAADLKPAGAQAKREARAEAARGEPPYVEKPETDSVLVASLKDTVVTTLIAAGLFFFFLGLRTDIGMGGLVMSQRWGLFFSAVAIVFVGRLLLNLLVWRRGGRGRAKAAVAAAWKQRPGRRLSLAPHHMNLAFGIVGVAFAVALPFMPFADRYIMDQAIVILTYIMLAWGLNIVVGLAGLLDLGYVAFYAVGAYSFALLATNFDLGFWICLPLAGVLAATWGLILGFPVLRLRGDYLAIVTLAFGEIIRVVLINWYEVTNGPDGISRIPRPTLFGIPFERGEGGFADTFGLEYNPIQRIIFLYYVILLLALITNFVTLRLRRLPVGRAWEALREDEIACRSLGINTVNTKLTAFGCGAMFGGFAGSFFATRQGFISPESFTALESFIILAVVVLGGLGSQIGIVIAALFLNFVFELRSLEEYRMLIVGLSMVLIMVWRPRGLISSRSPSASLHERKAISGSLVSQGEGH